MNITAFDCLFKLIAKILIAKCPIAEGSIAERPITKISIAKCPIAKSSIAKCPIAENPIAIHPIAKIIITQIHSSPPSHSFIQLWAGLVPCGHSSCPQLWENPVLVFQLP